MKLKYLNLMIMLLILVMAFFGTAYIGSSNDDISLEKIEQGIRKAAVTCYVLENGYPTLEHLVENYGISLQEDKYFYFYELEASNIPPNIKVIRK